MSGHVGAGLSHDVRSTQSLGDPLVASKTVVISVAIVVVLGVRKDRNAYLKSARVAATAAAIATLARPVREPAPVSIRAGSAGFPLSANGLRLSSTLITVSEPPTASLVYK